MAFDRDEAIRAAMNLFWLRGYSSVTASDLAQVMGITRSSLYNTFGTREAVFLESLKMYRTLSPERQLDAPDMNGSLSDQLSKFFREVCRIRATDRQAKGCMTCNAIAELPSIEPDLGKIVLELAASSLAAVEKLVHHAVASGELPVGTDCAATSNMILAFLIGLSSLSKVVRSETALWKTASTFLGSIGIRAVA